MKLNGKQIRLCIKIKWSENKIFAFEAQKMDSASKIQASIKFYTHLYYVVLRTKSV